MKRFITFTTDDNDTFFYAVNDVMSVKFHYGSELSMDLTTKSHGIETFVFDNPKDWEYAVEVFNDL